MIPKRLMAIVFLLAALGYVAVSFAVFEMPATESAAEECGFLPGEFSAAEGLAYARTEAWKVSFVRKQEYFTALTVGLAFAFMAFALVAGRRGGAASAGVAAGSGVLAVSALCISCIAPALSVVGLGVAGSFLAGVPKWLIALNTLLFTAWGTLFLSRRLATCALPPAQAGGTACAPQAQH
ncbi:hypothetical protein PIGHUM_00703 [Pigmentiphaga humi]|uniref:Uncharacterized protein n=1 Tax=Pigmentiphaga humi TaxID=2478468 RepID=A0A3P4AZ61_9BURK|nr:hypothetical protein [Pigmentiphaga humi]VCU68646.1 hypothetical protein PIGHUM_00703 [Pigmentiphaga humi]